MITQYAVIETISGQAPTDTTLKLELFTSADPDVVAYTSDTVTARTNAKTQYVAAFGEVSVIPAGDYFALLSIVSSGVVLASGYRTFLGTDGETATTKAAELDSAASAQLQAIEDGVDANTGYLTSLVSKFTGITLLADWLRRAFRKDAGTSGMATAETEINTGGTATFTGTTDNLEAIKDAAGGASAAPVFTAVVVSRVATGATVGWPADLTIGDAYLSETETSPLLYVKDIDDNVLSALGTKTFADVDFVGTLRLAPLIDGTRDLDTPPTTIEVTSADDPGILYNDDTPGGEYFELQIPRAKTLLGNIKTRYSCQFLMNWGGDATYERTVNLGETKFLRKNQAVGT